MVKHITLSLLLVVLLSLSTPTLSNAQTYHQSIGTNPFGLIWGQLNAIYEQQIAPKNSFTAFGTYWSWNDFSAFSIGGSYRFYLMQEQVRAIQGFSFGPLAQVAFWSWNGNALSSYGGGTVFYIGAEASYKWVFEGGWMVEPTFRVYFPLNTLEGTAGYSNYGFGANVGYAW